MAGPDDRTLSGVGALTVELPGRPRPVLDDVAFTVPEGKRVAVMGANGSGKTLLLMAIAGLVPSKAEWRRFPEPIAVVLQDPNVGWTSGTVEDEIGFALAGGELSEVDIAARTRELMGALDLTALRDRDPSTLSGGEQQRVQLAAVMAGRPRTLLLDEPTAFLDPTQARAFDDALDALDPSPGIVLRVTHDVERALACDRLLVLAAGRLVADGPPSDVVRDARCASWGLEGPDALRTARVLAEAGYLSEPLPVSWDGLSLETP